MKVLILGSGILGITTAYELGKRGFDVTVIDRQKVAASECSFANGGQLSYTHAEPWATPTSLKKLPKWLINPDAPLVLRLSADPAMFRWGLKFLRNCTQARANIGTVNLLRLGLYSKDRFEALRRETGIQFDFAQGGILNLFNTQKDRDDALKQAELEAKFGAEHQFFSRQQCMDKEPALVHTSTPIFGGMFDPQDETGDAHIYCKELAKFCAARYGVKFENGVTINKITLEGKTITSVVTDKGAIAADAYVMALGVHSVKLLARMGIRIPVYPMKGYSITIKRNEFCPNSSVADARYKVVYTRLGDRMRVAGTAEFAGYNDKIRERRIRTIIKAAKEIFPKADWSQHIDKWACLRPSTPDGPPILGYTPISNLMINTGHGTLGWTQAAASAAIVGDLMERKPPAILLQGLTLERFM